MTLSEEQTKKIEESLLNLAIVAMEEHKYRYDLLKEENKACHARVSELEKAIEYLLQYLNPESFSDQREDVIKMLKLLGYDYAEIKLYLAGELIL